MLNNKEEQLRERELAYTAPIDSDIPSSFQFHSDLMPQPAVRRKSAERSRRRLAIALVCIILVLLCLALAISLFLLRYQIILGRDDGGFEVRIIKREDTIINPLEVLQPNDSTGDSNPDADSPNDYQWNGITLKTEDLRQDGIQSWSLIYQACSGCVANVSAIDANGNVNKGSAVVMSSDGFLITSSHVVLYANDIQVNLQGSEYSAVLIGLDIASDLAVIRIQANSLTPAVFGQSELSAPGDDIAVLGTSYLGNAGISPGTMVSCAEQYAYRGFPMDLFELNIPVNAQYSGAPVVNQYGQVIGIINTDIDSQLSESANTSFAIPIHVAKGIVDQLLEYGYVPGRPSSGLTVAEIPTAYAMYYKYPSCVYVAAVNESSTAYEAGVRKGDLILSANGIKIQSVDQLYAVINGMEAGDEMTLELYRNGDLGSISFLLMEATRRVN